MVGVFGKYSCQQNMCWSHRWTESKDCYEPSQGHRRTVGSCCLYLLLMSWLCCHHISLTAKTQTSKGKEQVSCFTQEFQEWGGAHSPLSLPTLHRFFPGVQVPEFFIPLSICTPRTSECLGIFSDCRGFKYFTRCGRNQGKPSYGPISDELPGMPPI